MKVRLLFRDKDFDPKAEPIFNHKVLTSDLALTKIIETMAGEDKVMASVCMTVLLSPLSSASEIQYRQENLRDAISNPDDIRRLYAITTETMRLKKEAWFWASTSRYLSTIFSSAVDVLRIYTKMLMELRKVADESSASFRSEGFKNLLSMIQEELNDDYFGEVSAHLDELKSRNGMVVSAGLGDYLQGVTYVLRRKNPKGFWRRWRFAPSFTIAPRDDAGSRDLGKRRERAINEATNALAQSAEHLESFFVMLQHELAFYAGSLNLADTLHQLGMPISIPKALPEEQYDRSWRVLYDVSLSLIKGDRVVTNDFEASKKRLYVMTGANQGGKSTFLRSIGQAQLMMQCGLFVGAEFFAAPVRKGIFSHFKKEEDAAMKSGKLDEELSRMNEIATHLQARSLMLFNESFAATNEREGAEICRQITQALIDNDIEVFSVTHLYAYAVSFVADAAVQYLRAERLEDNARTFKLIEGKPLETAFGLDLYQKIFGECSEAT